MVMNKILFFNEVMTTDKYVYRRENNKEVKK